MRVMPSSMCVCIIGLQKCNVVMILYACERAIALLVGFDTVAAAALGLHLLALHFDSWAHYKL